MHLMQTIPAGDKSSPSAVVLEAYTNLRRTLDRMLVVGYDLPKSLTDSMFGESAGEAPDTRLWLASLRISRAIGVSARDEIVTLRGDPMRVLTSLVCKRRWVLSRVYSITQIVDPMRPNDIDAFFKTFEILEA